MKDIKHIEQIDVGSKQAILDTISSDFNTYQWFKMLIFSQKAKLQEFKKKYKKFFWFNIINVCFAGFLFACLISFFIFNIISCFYLSFLVLIGLFYFYCLSKKEIKDMACYFLDLHFNEEEIKKKTLYQVCEKLAAIYKIPSLVDVIYFSDLYSRVSFLVSFCIVSIVYALIVRFTFWKFPVFVFLLFTPFYFLFNSFSAYKRFK